MKRFIYLIAIVLLTQTVVAQSKQDENAIQDLVQTMATSWKEGNSVKFTSVFTEKHDYIVWNGYYRKDLSLNESASDRQRVFNTVFKNTEQHATIDKIEFLKEDVAMIHVLVALSAIGAKRPEHPELLWTGLLQKVDGTWKIKCLQLLDLELFEDEKVMDAMPVSPKVMFASWYADK